MITSECKALWGEPEKAPDSCNLRTQLRNCCRRACLSFAVSLATLLLLKAHRCIAIFIVREVWREEARGRSKVMIGRLIDYECS